MKSPSLPLFASLILAACGSSSETQKQAGAPSPEAAVTAGAQGAPVAEATAVDDKAEAKPDRDELVRKALGRVPDIQTGVAQLRGLPFKTEVPAEYQSSDDFRAFVKQEIQRELPPERNAKLGKALAHIGLLEQEMDLAKTLEDAMVSQAGAYYDPAQKKYFLVMVTSSDLTLDTISSHELTHALQDQHYDLTKYYYGHDGDGPPTFSEDELNARRFIVEGEATFVMVAYAAFSMAKVNMLEKPYVDKLRGQLEMFANMDIDALVSMTKSQAGEFADMGEDIQKSIEAMDKIPLYILVPLLESYMKGVMPVYEAYMVGGWDAVGKLYENPPNSTEQVLHPADKLVGKKRDYPVALSFDAPAGYEELHSEVIGELGWRVYFMLWKGSDPVASAAGWDGDRVAVYAKDGKLVGMIATTWDTAADAEEFEKAYSASLAKRFPSGARDDGTKTFIKRKGKDVYIVDGAADDSLLTQLTKTRKQQHKQDR